MSSKRTAWHPPFTTAMRERGPRWVTIRAEVQLTEEPHRADDVIEVRVDLPRDLSDCGTTLRGLWPEVRVVALLEFKSTARPFRRGDLARLMAYGLIWFYTRQEADDLTIPSGEKRRAQPDDLTLVLVVPTLTPTLRDEIEHMRLALVESADGYHRATGFFCTLLVIELGRVSTHEHDELMGWFAGRTQRLSVDLVQWIGQNTSIMATPDKASPDLEGFAQWFAQLRDALPPEMRIAGMSPEEVLVQFKPEQVLAQFKPAQRIAGLAPEEVLVQFNPEQRLAGLPPEDIALALPDEALRALPDSYLATLPEDAQRRIRARLHR